MISHENARLYEVITVTGSDQHECLKELIEFLRQDGGFLMSLNQESQSGKIRLVALVA